MTYNVFSGTLNPTESINLWKKLSGEVLAWLSVWSKLQMICIWSSWCHCHPIISCFIIKIQIGLTFLMPGCVVKWVSVCLCWYDSLLKNSDSHCSYDAVTGNWQDGCVSFCWRNQHDGCQAVQSLPKEGRPNSNCCVSVCVWVYCFIKTHIALTFLVLAYPGCPGKKGINRRLLFAVGGGIHSVSVF